MTRITAILFMLMSDLLMAPGATEKPLVQLNLNWPAYMAQHDLLWDCVPEDYFAGAFVGNGLLGTIIFKDDIQPKYAPF